jgi:hypothetical protein
LETFACKVKKKEKHIFLNGHRFLRVRRRNGFAIYNATDVINSKKTFVFTKM